MQSYDLTLGLYLYKTALFNSEKPWISIEFTSSNLILKVVWQNPGEEMIIAVSDRTPASNVFKIVVAVQLLSHVQLFVTPGTAACEASLSFIIFWSWLKLMSIESVMPSNHLVLCRPLLLSSIFLSIGVFLTSQPFASGSQVLELQFQYQFFQWIFRTDFLQDGLVWIPACSPRDSQESSSTPQFKSINSSALSLLHSPTLTSTHDHRKNHSLD